MQNDAWGFKGLKQQLDKKLDVAVFDTKTWKASPEQASLRYITHPKKPRRFTDCM